MVCPNCQTINRDGARFCDNCGKALPAACPGCGAVARPGARFCDNCGEQLVAAAPSLAIKTAPAQASGRVGRTLHQFIPDALLAKLEAAQAGGGMVGERRVVTVLFCDVKGSTAAAERLDPEEWTEIMNGAFEHLIAPVYQYEGTLARMMGDAILAFFGAPIAHEDDPQRAVLAGLEIVQGLQPYRQQINSRWGLDFDVRVGVNTGLVVVGPVGSDLHMEYTALGDAINVAARMEQTARPGTVQIAGATHRLVAPLFEFEALGPLEIKGKTEPVLAYRALGPRAAPGRLRGLAGHSAPLVGREAEMASLRRALGGALAGSGQLVCLLGEAGLGKSRLIRELNQDFESAAVSGGRWLEAASLSYEASQPYGLTRRLLRAACSATENDPPDVLRTRLASLIALLPTEQQAGAALMLAALFDLDEAPGTGQPAAPRLQGESFRLELFAALPALCRAWASQGPLLMVVEDLHWADPASVGLLEHLLPLVNEVGLLLLFALRPDERAPGWQLKLAAERDYTPRLTQVEVRPLNAADSGALVDHLLPAAGLAPSLRERILARVEGNPFFVEEVVRAVIDNQAQAGRSEATPAAAGEAAQFEIPDTLQSLLTARIDRLSEEDRRTLQMASIVGRSFYYRVLSAILDAGISLDARLNELEHVNLIFEAVRQPEREYTFRHALLHEAAYRTILHKHRREFHQRVGEALESLFPAQIEQYAPALGFHFEEAGDTVRALKYYALAGDAAYRLFANAEAEGHYARALKLAHHTNASAETLLHLYTRHGRTLELLSRFKEAVANYEALEALGRQRANQTLELYGLAGRALIRAMANTAEGDMVQAEDLLARGLALAQSLGDQAAEARLEWSRLNFFNWTDQLPEARRAGERSLELARGAGLREQMAYALQDLCYIYFATGDIPRVTAATREVIGLWRELRNQPMLTNAMSVDAMLHLGAGEFDASLTVSDEGYQLSAAIGNWWGMAFNKVIAGLIHWDRGDPARAIAVGEDVLVQARRSGFIIPLFVTPMVLAEIYADLGALPQALALLAGVRELKAPIARMYQSTLQAVEIRAHLLNGQAAEALSLSDAQPGLFSKLSTYYVRGTGFYLVGLAAAVESELGLLRGEPRQVIALTQALELEANTTYRRGLADIYYWRGRAQQAAGEMEEAAASLRAARAQAEMVGQRRALWPILALQAEMAAQAGDSAQADQLLTEARSIISGIADLAGSDELRKCFLGREAVKIVMGE